MHQGLKQINSAADSINKATAHSNLMKGNGDLPVPEYDDFNTGVDQLLLSPKRNNAIKLGSVLICISSAIQFYSELDIL